MQENDFDTELIPRDVLFGNPERAAARISPDGLSIAYLAPLDGVLNVWVKKIGTEDCRVITKDKERGVRNFFWAHNNRHILYFQDMGGDENWRLYCVDLETDAVRDLTPFDNVQTYLNRASKYLPNEITIGMNKDNPKLHDIYRVNLMTGELKLIAKNPGTVLYWVADANLNVLAAKAATSDGGADLLLRDHETAEWRKLIHWDLDDVLSGPICFSKDREQLYLYDSRNANTLRLVKLTIRTGELEVIVEDSQYDATDVIIHPDTYNIQAVAFTKSRKEWTVIDEQIKEDFSRIKMHERGDFEVMNRDHADRFWIVLFVNDNASYSYHIYDRSTKSFTFLFFNKPELRRYMLSEMEPISFTARDGLLIHGYIVFPPEKERRNLPMVLNVHGGPWTRRAWGFDQESQWLANRGYLCLIVNYRGSTGYGKKFVNAGNREWGGKMHDDLVDAVNWAVSKGFVDPTRVAIYGGSYGGYASLVGATFTPDLFKCAVDLVGVSNLVTFLKSIPPYWTTALPIWHKRIGNPDTDEEFLKSRSPLFKIDQIKIPILIAQGANDPRVKQAESEQIVSAMKSKGLEYEYLLFPDEGHGFAKPQNRLKFYAAVEKFLAKHLGGRFEN